MVDQFWSRRLAARLGPLCAAIVLGIVRLPTERAVEGSNRTSAQRTISARYRFMGTSSGGARERRRRAGTSDKANREIAGRVQNGARAVATIRASTRDTCGVRLY